QKKDEGRRFSATKCPAAGCDPEPSVCSSGGGSTSTTAPTPTTSSTTTPTPTTTSTTTNCTPMGIKLKGALTATIGHFNYNMKLGVCGANDLCNTSFPGTHACTYAELKTAADACDLKNLKDTASMTVTSFWAIDPAAAT